MTSREIRQRRSELASRAVSNLVLKGKGRARPEQIIEVDDGGEPEASGSGSGGTRSGGTPRTRVGVRKVVALSLVDLSFVLGLVFGGCCSNVWAYEYLLKIDPKMGTTLTFSQMIFVTLLSLPTFLIWDHNYAIPIPRLRRRQVPLKQWILQVLVHTTGSLLNNWAFAFHVPLTVQIVFRSAGLVVSILLGFLFMHKRYSFSQIIAILVVSTGVIFATLSRPTTTNSKKPLSDDDFIDYSAGVLMLTISLLLTGILGLLQEKTYTIYGPCWREGVFYTHFLSLPVFFFLGPHVKHGFRSLYNATNKPLPFPADELSPLDHISRYMPYISLVGNLITQLVCVSGVNQLTSHVSSVSTNLVLTTRKAISLCFSVWWFGNGWNSELGIGASMVFLGSLGYTYVTPRTNTSKKSISSGNNGGFAERREEGNAGNGNVNVNENENGRVGGDGIDEDVVEEDGEGDVREVKKRQ